MSLLLREVDFESRGGQDRLTMRPALSPRMLLLGSSPLSPGCRGFAYECESFLVAEVEPETTCPSWSAEQLTFNPGTV